MRRYRARPRYGARGAANARRFWTPLALTVIASKAEQSIAPQAEAWIASSLWLLAMTENYLACRPRHLARTGSAASINACAAIGEGMQVGSEQFAAFSSEVESCSRQENASNQKIRSPVPLPSERGSGGLSESLFAITVRMSSASSR